MTIENRMMYEKVRELLVAHAVNGFAAVVLAPLVAKTSLEMHHLYDDLGFKSRSEMGRFMKRNFPHLAMQKPKDKLWKKYLYDRIDAVAPACASCDDQQTCFRCMVSEVA